MKEADFIFRFMPLKKPMYALAYSLLRSESDAADCLQEAYTRMWEKRDRLKDMENPEGYCMVTVRRIAIDMIRHRGKDEAGISGDPPPDIPAPEASPSEISEHRDDLRILSSLLEQLPERQRQVVEMSGVSGLSNRQIEEATGLSSENVRTLLSRGRKKLRELFDKRR